MTIDEYLRLHQDRVLAELIEFAAIPSVSTDSDYRAGMVAAAKWVAAQLQTAGVSQVQILPTAGHPVVYGEWLGAAGRPTVLVYGHYDVQPPDPLDKWVSPPFQPEVRDGQLYGRGVSDDKGPMLIPIKVAQAYLATAGALPVNLKLLFEGEEEVGSAHLEQFIRDHAQKLAADFVLSADGAMWRIDEPSITVAGRGLAGLEFSVRGAVKDLHSGRHGGAVANPLHAISELIAGLHTADGRVAVAGFYDDVRPLTAAERQQLSSLPFDDEVYLRQVGAPSLFGEMGYSTPERLWARPTLDVNGLWGGYQGEGGKTVIPSEAHAKVTCRLVADQKPDDIVAKLVAHLEVHTPPGVSLNIRRDRHGAAPYRIPDDHPGLRIAEQSLAAVYGQTPLRVRMGGTLPVAALFQQILGIHTVFFSFSTADEDFHAPNEFLRIHRLHEGLAAWATYWRLLGQGIA